MIKRVEIKIHSVINDLENGLAAGDAEINDITVSGTLHEGAGETLLSYSEKSEGGSVLTRVRISDDCVSVTRQGAISSVMVFDTNKKFDTVYEIAPYKFDMSITTLRLNCNISPVGGEIDIRYKMTVGGADKLCRMKLSVKETSV